MIVAPRKLSVNGEYGFPSAYAITGKVRITIDGDSRCSVIAYDCDEGWVESYVHDDAGKYVQQGDEWVRKREYGQICAIILD